MRYIKVFMARGGAVKTYVGKKGGVTRKPIFAYQGGRGVKKPENPAYIVYGWSLKAHCINRFEKPLIIIYLVLAGQGHSNFLNA